MPNEQAVLMNIPQEMVTAHVKAAIAQVLNRDPEALVRAVVDAAMAQKKDSYDRTTLWDQRLNEMIRSVAESAAREWITEQAPKIRDAVRKRFDASKSKFVAELCDKVAEALTTNLMVSISIKDSTR